MCGIAGVINLNGQSTEPLTVQGMMARIKHRGPDDEGIFISDNICLGHVRLSILDLSPAGHQPMFSNDDRYCIVFNGEIYNYLELKNEIGGLYQFKTKTDTEVLLASYIVWGESFLSKLNGDFAFVIYDKQTKTVFGARDRFGIKPFYYYKDDNRFIFASELKAITPVLENLLPNDKIIFEYLAYNRTDQSHETFFKDTVKLKHGHCFTIKNGKFETKQWYDLNAKIKYPTSMSAAEYREELHKSLKLRLRSDVPIGVSLSGGIDSSSITSIIYNDFDLKELNSFSAVFDKNHWADESQFINAYSDKLKHMHFVSPDGDTFYNEFIEFIVTHGEPIPAVSPYAQYKVMELAKGKVTVTLDGQGADEMLGGSNYFYGSYFNELTKQFRFLKLAKEIKGYLSKNPSKEAFPYFVYYLLPGSVKNFAGRKKFGSLTADFYNTHYKNSTVIRDFYNHSSVHEFFLKHFEYKLEHLLKYDDLNAMHFSIESRVPFLDHNLVEKTLALPADYIMKDGITKHILRESVKDVLPPQIYKRYDKKGFDLPSDQWLSSQQFQGFITQILNSDKFKSRGYFDVEDCKMKYQKHLDKQANYTNEIWKWINLEVWFQKFIDK